MNIEGRLTLDAPIVASDVGSSIVIDADSFVNNLGVDGLSPGGGRYLVYSLDPANDTRNVSADEFSKRYDVPFDPTDPEGSNAGLGTVGNFFLYAIAPTLSIVANRVAREYGDANPELTFTSNGLIDGDTLAVALTESPSLTTTAEQTSDVGVFPIEVGPGTLDSPLNYALNLVDGALDVTRAPLDATANDAARVVGEQNPVFTASFAGFKLGDDAAVVTGLQFDTPAGFASPPGQFPIVPFGAAAENYALDFTNGTLFVALGSAEDIPDGGIADRIDIPVDEKFDPPVPPPLTIVATPVYEFPVFTGRVSVEDLLFANDGNRELWGPSGSQ